MEFVLPILPHLLHEVSLKCASQELQERKNRSRLAQERQQTQIMSLLPLITEANEICKEMQQEMKLELQLWVLGFGLREGAAYDVSCACRVPKITNNGIVEVSSAALIAMPM